jgi:hypothetical protein
VNTNHKLLVFVAIAGFMTGCYTRFATIEERSITPDSRTANTGSAGSGVADSLDTLKKADDETCVWERDLMGFPYLRCYKGYYPREWYRNNFSPWWYQTDAHLYDRSRCPAYYYYDKSCGCCRYYLNNPELERTSRGIAKKRSSAVPADRTAQQQDSAGQVSISASTRTTAAIPLRSIAGNSATSPKYQVVKDSPATKTAQATSDTSATAGKNIVDSTSVDSVQQTIEKPDTPRPTEQPAQKRPRRSMRGR